VASEKDVFVKTVISLQTDREDMVRAMDLVAREDPEMTLVIQPNTYDIKEGVMKRCIEFQDICLKRLKDVRVIPQMHKIMKVR